MIVVNEQGFNCTFMELKSAQVLESQARTEF